jgi:muramoyltetrapeptide carboxypeptidase
MRLGLICPCGPPHLGKTLEGMEILRSWGLEVVPGPVLQGYLQGQGRPSLAFLAAEDSLRATELAWGLGAANCQQLSGAEVEACWVVRGGVGLTRLQLPTLARPRPVFGFSDVSVLLHGLQRRGWKELFHCANVQTLPTLTSSALEATRRLVAGKGLLPLSGRPLREGRAEGVLWGGNLCVLTCLCGTAEAMRGEPGRILALEDVTEAPYRIDRMLTQLEASGAFQGLAGVALGQFTECGNLEAVWKDWAQRWSVPVLADLPFGHDPNNHPLQLGASVVLDYNQISWVERSIFSGSGAGP